jgi:hypothetical protein
VLEARWAVFFDNAGIPFEYEYVGYKLGELGKTWYLPDFWLPEQRAWVEIKPHSDFVGNDIKKITHFEQTLRNEYLAEKAARERTRRHAFYVFVGSPYFNGSKHSYEIFTVMPSDIDKSARYVPTEFAAELEIRKSVYRWMHCPLCKRLQLTRFFGQVRDIYGKAEEERMLCLYCRDGDEKYEDDFEVSCCHNIPTSVSNISTTRVGHILGSPRLMKGYIAAREFKIPRKGSS